MSYSEEPLSANSPSQEALEAELANFKPRPSERFYRRMATAPWLATSHSTRGNLKPSNFSKRVSENSLDSLKARVLAGVANREDAVGERFQTVSKWAVATLFGVTLFLGLTATSCGRTLADEAFKLFVHAQSDTRPLEEMSWAVTPSQGTPVSDWDTQLSVSELETRLGFDIKEPTILPDQFHLDQTFFVGKKVGFLFQSPVRDDLSRPSVVIFQQPVHDFTSAKVGPEASIIEVQIGGVKGEYVEGGFGYGPGEKVVTWHADGSLRTLLWVKDEMLFGIECGGGVVGQPDYVGLTEMIAIAEGLK